jgi:hypothetical protein
MDSLVKLINEIYMAVYQISPPSIQDDLLKARDEYVSENHERK